MNRSVKRMAIFALVLCLSLLTAPAFAGQPFVRHTPEEILVEMSHILAGNQPADGSFASLVRYDGTGGFGFCTIDGDSTLQLEGINAQLSGMVDEDGRIYEINLVMQPSGEFGEEYAARAEWISRVFLTGVFSDLSDRDLEILMNAYRYEICPYRYREGDTEIPLRLRMCELQFQEEIALFESETEKENVIRLHIKLVDDADEDLFKRGQQGNWRVVRLTQAVSECKMIQTCGEILVDIEKDEFSGQLEEIDALVALCEECVTEASQLQSEYMRFQEKFMESLQEKCEQISEAFENYHAARESGDEDDAWLHMQKVCGMSLEIGNLPDMLLY